MFRRKENTSPDPLPYGLRSDLRTAGEKLAYRARTFHAAFGKDAEALQREFLTECRLSVLAFLQRKEATSALDQAAYAAAFSADLSADQRSLLPRLGMRSLGQTFVLARRRGLIDPPDTPLTEAELATLEPLWSIIEHASVLPGNGNGRAFAIGELGRIRSLVRERSASATSESKQPTMVREVKHPTLVRSAAPVEPPRPPAPAAPAVPDEEPLVLSAPPNPRPAIEVFADFPWAEAFAAPAEAAEAGKFFLPASLASTLEQARLRYRTARLLLKRNAEAHELSRELQLLERHELFVLGAFLSAGLGPTTRDLRLMERLMDLPPGHRSLPGWQSLALAIRESLELREAAAFLPPALQNTARHPRREAVEAMTVTAVEGTLLVFDALLAMGSDDDGSRAAFRQEVYRAQLDRAHEYGLESNRQCREQLPSAPAFPADLLGSVLGERFAKLPDTLRLPGRDEARLEQLRRDFALHFSVMFASAARQPGPPGFFRHTVAILDRLDGAARSPAVWRAWHQERLAAYGLDPFVYQPQYLRELLHAASVSPARRAELDQLIAMVENLVLTYVEDVLGGAQQENVLDAFARLKQGIHERLGPPRPPADVHQDTAPVEATAGMEETTADHHEPADAPPAAALPDGHGEDWDWEDLPTEQPTRASPGSPESEVKGDPAVPAEAGPDVSEPEQVLRDAAALSGMVEFRQQLLQLHNLAKVRELRRQNGLPLPEFRPHAVFAGNPGTGRSTAARLLGRLYRAHGLLGQGHVVEVNAAGLMQGNPADTDEALLQAIQRALDGVLMIERAYSLVELDQGGGLIGVLLRRLDEYPDRLAVILAGEEQRMNDCLDANPALRARFGRVIRFPELTPSELAMVLQSLAARHGYRLQGAALEAAQEALKRAGADGTNGLRRLPPLFDLMLSRHADRVASLAQVGADDLIRFEAPDVPPA